METGVPSGTLVGATFSRSTGDAWTIEVPMVPWACRADPFVDCAFGFLQADGAGVEYGRPFASYVLRPTDFCTLSRSICDYAAVDPDPCMDLSPLLTCAESAWIRSVCGTASFDALPAADAPFCQTWPG